MKEREERAQSNLTRQELNSRLSLGGNLMSDEKGPEQPIDEKEQNQGPQRTINKISDAVTGEITPAVKDIRDDVRKLREQKEREEEKKALANFKRRVSSAWKRQYPNLEGAPAELRSFIRASIDGGFMPDRMTDEQRSMFENFARKTQEIPPAGGGGGGEGEPPRKPPAQPAEGEPEPEQPIAREPILKEEPIEEGAFPQGMMQMQIDMARSKLGQPLTPQEEKMLIESITPRMGEERLSPRDRFIGIKDHVENAGSLEELEEIIKKRLNQEINLLKDVKDFPELKKELEEIKKLSDIDEAKKRINDLINKATKFFPKETDHNVEIPRSLEDLLELIIASEGEGSDWDTNGDNELIDSNGQARLDNFQAWIEEKILFYHNFNPTGTIDLFGSIAAPTLYRTISFSEMVYFARYFRKREEGAQGKRITVTNADYEKLKNNLIYNVYLFNMSHNYKIQYWQVRGQETKVPEAMTAIHDPGVFTRGSNMETMYTIASTAAGDILNGKENYFTGNAIRIADLAYLNSSDLTAIRAILGKDSPLFKKEYFEVDDNGHYVLENGKYKKVIGHGVFRSKGEKDFISWSESWYDDQENLKWNDPRIRKRFGEYINVLGVVHPDPTIIKEVRERIRQSLAGKIEKQAKAFREKQLGRALTDKELLVLRKRAHRDATFAEEFSYVKTNWTGINATSDKEGIAHDAGTKVVATEAYRKRRISVNEGDEEGLGKSRRLGTTGNIYNIEGVKRLGTNFYNGMEIKPVVRPDGSVFRETLLEKLQAGKTIEQLLEDNSILDERIDADGIKLEFLEETERQWVANQILSAFTLFIDLVNENNLDLEKVAVYENGRLVRINQEQYLKVIDKIGKALRYAFSTYSQLKYDALVRDNITGETVPMAFYMFNDELLLHDEAEYQQLQELRRQAAETGDRSALLERQKEIAKREQANRGDIWVKALEYYIAAELFSHRDLKSPYPRYGAGTMENIHAFLESLPGDIGYSGEMNQTAVNKTFFDKEEMDWIRKKSKSGTARMFGEEFAFESGVGLAGGALKGLQVFIKSLFS